MTLTMRWSRSIALSAIAIALSNSSPAARAQTTPGNNHQTGGAQWIWTPQQQAGRSPAGVCFFRKSFDLLNPEQGTVEITCDDRYELYVNGHRVGTGKNWSVLDSYDITRRLKSGRNTVAVKAYNDQAGSAGIVARVTVRKVGGTTVAHSTNSSWRSSLRETSGWETIRYDDTRWARSRSMGELGRAQPWGNRTKAADGSQVGRFRHSKEFRVERVIAPEETGSLLAMTFNEWGQIVASRENGPLLLVSDSDTDGILDTVDTYSEKVTDSQGILALNGQIFAVGDGPQGAAFYRLTDEDNDRKAETVEALFRFHGKMHEHGPHAAVLGPDGLIYLMVGNHASIEPAASPGSPYQHDYEGDLLQPRYEDPGGHAEGIASPGSVVLRTDTQGSFVEVFAGGLRNPYDLAFNRQGDLFTFDSDMEWDEGLPWYRPTRINHVTPGAEFGWRSGWAKFPEYYLDNLPATVDIGRGSPTGVEVYDHYKYPLRYHNAVFVADWTRGRILAIRLRQQGGTYTASPELFLSGRPLNVTDLAVGPDGWLYFCTGGRDTEGGIYRVVWTPKVPPRRRQSGAMQAIHQPQLNSAWARNRIAQIRDQLGDQWETQLIAAAENRRISSAERTRALDLMQLFGPSPKSDQLVRISSDRDPQVRAKVASLLGIHANPAGDVRLSEMLSDEDANVRRRACEALVDAQLKPSADRVIALLADKDRFVAWAARRLLERLPPDVWREKVLAADNHRTFLVGATALMTAAADRTAAEAVLTKCQAMLAEDITDPDFLDLLRVMQLALIHGGLNGDDVPEFVVALSQEYPALDATMNRELVRLLTYLQDETVSGRLVEELKGEADTADKLHVAMHARFLDSGWTTEQKFTVLDFYEQARQAEGGYSLSRYVENAARDFFPKLTEDEHQLVLVDGANLPTSALNVLRSLNDLSDAALVSRLIRLDRQIAGLDTPAAKQLGTGIAAILGLSRDDEAMAYLREIFLRQPDRRDELAMGLAQSPDEENWLLLVDALPALETSAAREVLNRLTDVNRTPDDPEPLRQAILAGLRLQENGHQQAVSVLEHWTGRRLTTPDDTWETAIAAWQDWFRAEYPDQPDPSLPTDAEGSKWQYDELLEYLTDGGSSHGDPVRGAAVFEKATCAKCHRYDRRGETIGPDLTTLSLRFRKKEILESILFPSQVISDQYAAKTVQTDAGLTYTGIVGSAGENAVVILQANAEKVTVLKSEIVDTYPAKKSAMPDGLLNELTLEEIADLFAYLGKTPQVNLEAKLR